MTGSAELAPPRDDPSDATSDEVSSDSRPSAAPLRRAPRINEAHVFAAADALLLGGDRPTIDRVRMRLGRGSPNTINDHLDTWWSKLGARLRDVPGREFPQLPEPIAQTLQKLWIQALEGAHEALDHCIQAREAALILQGQENERVTAHLSEREHTSAARNAALEDSLTLAREELLAANRRAEVLERSLEERAQEALRWRARAEALESSNLQLRSKDDADSAAHRTERTSLQERHAAAEAHWLTEVDRARQSARETAKRYEIQLKEQRGAFVQMQTERHRLAQELAQSRLDSKKVNTLNHQLAKKLQAQPPRTSRTSLNAKLKAQDSVRSKRPE